MFVDLWKDFLRRFWWTIVGAIIIVISLVIVVNYYQQVEVSGYRISSGAAKATEYYQNGDLEKAEAQYKMVIKQSPRDWFSWNGLANIYRDQNLYGLAEEAYLKALDINPRFEQVYRNIFNLYYAWSIQDASQLNKSEAILLRGLKLMSKSESVLEDLIAYYAKTDDQQKLQQYRAILDAIRDPQPKAKPNSILAPFISK